MNNRQIDQKPTKQVRIDSGLHHQLKILAAKDKKSLRELVEGCLIELLGVEPYEEDK